MTMLCPCLRFPAATTIFDTGAICDDAPSLGYFYLHNSCNLTFSLAVKVGGGREGGSGPLTEPSSDT